VAKGALPESGSFSENYYYVLPLPFRDAAILFAKEHGEDAERGCLCFFVRMPSIAVFRALRGKANKKCHIRCSHPYRKEWDSIRVLNRRD
jgi:hypothetical protein